MPTGVDAKVCGAMKLDRPEYVPGLDLLRFAAAFSVMVYHLAFWSWAFPAGQVALASKGVANFQDWPLITSAGWIGVQIFFVISGFVIATSAANATATRFFISRFTRLVPSSEGCRPPPQPVGSSCCQLTRLIMTRMACPLCSTDITPLQRYYGTVRP